MKSRSLTASSEASGVTGALDCAGRVFRTKNARINMGMNAKSFFMMVGFVKWDQDFDTI
jgi:hypothetical protein